MNIFEDIRAIVDTELGEMVAGGFLPTEMAEQSFQYTVEAPRDPSHGDVSVNAALVLSKLARMKPRDLAEALATALTKHEDIEKAEVAGPGFVNLRLARGVWHRTIGAILDLGEDYGRGSHHSDHPVNVEFVSANPTGPMHVGHCRGAVFGDSLCNLLEFAGYDVTREYYTNDAGSQIDTLARSVHLRYREALGEDIGEIPEGLYPGQYLIPVGQQLAQEFGDKYAQMEEGDWLHLFKRRAVDAMMVLIREDLGKLGIHHDVFFSEFSLHESGRVQEMVDDLTKHGHVYRGILEPPKGKEPEGWEPREQLLFKATEFGDDVDRPLQKSNGDFTYFAADIAYHYDKIQRGFYDMIDVLGADHGGYVKRMKAAVKAVSEGKAELDIKLAQMVRLFKNGEPYKMSKRAGTFVTLADLVEEVGKDVVRFIMLTRKNDAQLDFDLVKVLEQSKDNPVFYVQYAHARICSVLRKMADAFPDQNFDTEELNALSLELLDHEDELALMKKLGEWPRLVDAAATAHEPHRVAFYLYDLAQSLHSLWNRGNDDPGLRFLIEGDLERTAARAAMITAVRQVIANGLKILGVTPVEEMR
ncbi:MAG: arginine--tRNA ligase [Sphingomonadales bacterium]|jgi:arginyl-tRNA synthetase